MAKLVDRRVFSTNRSRLKQKGCLRKQTHALPCPKDLCEAFLSLFLVRISPAFLISYISYSFPGIIAFPVYVSLCFRHEVTNLPAMPRFVSLMMPAAFSCYTDLISAFPSRELYLNNAIYDKIIPKPNIYLYTQHPAACIRSS